MQNIGQVLRMEPSTFGFNMYGIGKGYSIGVIVNNKLTIPQCEILEIFEDNSAIVKIDGHNGKHRVSMDVIKTKPRHIDHAITF